MTFLALMDKAGIFKTSTMSMEEKMKVAISAREGYTNQELLKGPVFIVKGVKFKVTFIVI